MTIKTEAQLSAEFQSTDPQDWVDNLLDSLGGGTYLFSQPITFETTTFTLGTVPANSIIEQVIVTRTTAWDVITSFVIGKSGDTDWLVTTLQAALDSAIDAGEEGNAEIIEPGKVVTTATPVVVTIDQGAASVGAGFVTLVYRGLS